MMILSMLKPFALCLIFCVTINVCDGLSIDQNHIKAWYKMQHVKETFEIYREDNVCYVLFSPSDNLDDWLANIDFQLDSVEISCPRETTPTHNTHTLRLGVTQGYGKSWEQFVENDGNNLVKHIFQSCSSCDEVSFVGWSKGGAFATLAAITAMYQTKRCDLYPTYQKKNIGLVTFGTPRFLKEESVEYILESSEDFKQIKKTRYCLDDDWGCNVYFDNFLNQKNPDHRLNFVHWGDQIGYDTVNGVHTYGSSWNSPDFKLGDTKTLKYAQGLASFLFESLLTLITPGKTERDPSKIHPYVLSHMQYAIFGDGINVCPMSSFNCSMKERLDPKCYQYYTQNTLENVCTRGTDVSSYLLD